MNLPTAEQQNAQLLARVSPRCQTLTCLRRMKPLDLVQLGRSWDVSNPPLPSDFAGLRLPGLVIVDGALVRSTSLTARYTVPTLVSTMRNEMENLLGRRHEPSTWSAFEAQLQHAMSRAWPSTAPTDILGQYRRFSLHDAYVRLVTDIRVACASLVMAQRHTGAFQLHNLAPPSATGGLQTSIGPMTLPFHTWDYQLAFEAYNARDVIGNVSTRYTPTASDKAVGASLRALWWNLVNLANHSSSSSWPLCEGSTHSRRCYTELHADGSLQQVRNGHLFDRCKTLSKYDLVRPAWWWAN